VAGGDDHLDEVIPRGFDVGLMIHEAVALAQWPNRPRSGRSVVSIAHIDKGGFQCARWHACRDWHVDGVADLVGSGPEAASGEDRQSAQRFALQG